jgi:hypothetical protein
LFPFPSKGRPPARVSIIVSPSRTSLGGLFLCAYTRGVGLWFGVVIAVVLVSGVAWWVASARKAGPSLAKKNYCMFCGPTDNKITKEHVWPVWISELLKPLMEGNTFTTQRFKDGKTIEKQWDASEINIQAKALCDYCNNVWLGQEFEGAIIKPLLSDAIANGTSTTFTAEQLGSIAAWAYKMALVLEFATPRKEVFFTETERFAFRRTRAAHPFVSVRLAKYDFSENGEFRAGHSYNAVHTMTEAFGSRRTLELKVTTMTAGYFVMQVIAVRDKATGELVDAREVEVELSPQAAASLVQIWPPTVKWPPRLSLKLADLLALTEMWGQANK